MSVKVTLLKMKPVPDDNPSFPRLMFYQAECTDPDREDDFEPIERKFDLSNPGEIASIGYFPVRYGYAVAHWGEVYLCYEDNSFWTEEQAT